MQENLKKLNFGCGKRYASEWTNIDFHSDGPGVRRVNLLGGFPFPDNHFDAVYSSHVLEHFTRGQGLFLMREAHRVLKPGGVVRTVLPDLESSCREYLRILDSPDPESAKRRYYEWAVIELLDQLVRTASSGEMGKILVDARTSGDTEFFEYLVSRTQRSGWNPPARESLVRKLRKLNPQKLSTKCAYWYLKVVKLLIPRNLRAMVFIETEIGERHRWMYDRLGLRLLLEDAGFRNSVQMAYDGSAIPGFDEDALDAEKDGTPYKNNSLYFEAFK